MEFDELKQLQPCASSVWALMCSLREFKHASGWAVQIYLIIYVLAPLLDAADTGKCKNVRHTI